MSSLYPWHLHTVIFSYTFPSSAVTVTVTGFPTCRGPTMSLKFSSEVCLCHLPASYISHSTCSHSALDLVSIWNMLGTKSIRQSHNILIQCSYNVILITSGSPSWFPSWKMWNDIIWGSQSHTWDQAPPSDPQWGKLRTQIADVFL